MDYDTTRRYPHNATLGFPQYYYSERNMPLTVSHLPRAEPRNSPVVGSAGDPRCRGNLGREDGAMESAQSRRRIAVACARCRKRKIRCSGDPGNSSGCLNCKQAGVDMITCQFHRVGSEDVHQIIANRMTAPRLAYVANPYGMMPIHTVGSSPFYTRTVPTSQYPQLETKPVYSQDWANPYAEETSPVEAYNLDQPTAYMPSTNNLINVYGSNDRWNETNRKALHRGQNTYLEQETQISSSYSTHNHPYIQTNLRAASGSGTQSPLRITSLQSTIPISLPQRPHPRQTQVPEAGVPLRQLPIPQPSPAQSSRNVVDQLQDQRLRSAQIMSGSSLSNTGSYSKTALTWNTEPNMSEIQDNTTLDASSAEPLAQAAATAQVSGVSDGVMGYTPVINPVNEAGTASSPPPSQQQQQKIKFNASTLLETMPAPTATPTYSNFRNYTLPTSSSSEQLSILARQSSLNNLYNFTSDSASKRHSLGDLSNEAALVSGQQYTPLSQPQTQQAAGIEGLRRDGFDTTHAPLHRASTSNLNRSY